LFVLLMRVRDVFASGDQSKHLLPDDGLHSFIEYSRRTLGEDYFRTPRDTVMRFIGLMNLLEAEPSHDWRAALGQVEKVQVAPTASAEANTDPAPDDDDLVEFNL
jgi:hypothetical protein